MYKHFTVTRMRCLEVPAPADEPSMALDATLCFLLGRFKLNSTKVPEDLSFLFVSLQDIQRPLAFGSDEGTRTIGVRS